MASYGKISDMFDANPFILRILVNSESLSQARHELLDYLNKCHEEVNSIESPLHPLEKKNTRSCIEVFRNILAPINEQKTKFSCLQTLWELATEHWRQKDWPDISDAFLVEMKHLFKGVIGLSGIYSKSGICKREVPAFVNLEGRDAAIVRSNLLNEKADQYKYFVRRNGYQTGLEPYVLQKRQESKTRILEFLGGTESDWNSFEWHLRNAFSDLESINRVIELSDEEKSTISLAKYNDVPFSITPYYLSLLDTVQSDLKPDRSLREHVIPNRIYLERMSCLNEEKKKSLDFMHEMDTSPVELVTRRYPLIAIFKPYNSCPQICVYCQRNWELAKNVKIEALATKKKMDQAFAWFRNNQNVEEVLITGGDPLIMDDQKLDEMLSIFSDMSHIKRIRFGTRTFITLPMRFTDNLLNIINKYHDPPARTITFVTHIQHPYEISLELAALARKLKLMGIDIYNQQVFTIQNCRKFESCYLRENLKSIGISPYYLFNLKGKEETSYFKVPIARLLQETKEEARLMPGLLRTDKQVFNVPTLGKNDLGSWQDHDIIMILNNGSRVYEFYPWEKYMAPVNTYLYKDEPIYDFLKRLEDMGESPEDYKTIWYYF